MNNVLIITMQNWVFNKFGIRVWSFVKIEMNAHKH
jgi:type IV secretory pathway TrbD component